MKLDTILVPLDGSPLAEAALPTAMGLAKSGDAKLLLLRATQAHTLPGVDPTDAQIKVVREAEEYLTQMAARLRAYGLARVETSVWYGPPAHAIVDGARFQKANLIVMTTHGRSGLGRLVLGSVAESVLRGTRIPILLIRTSEAPVEPPVSKGEATPWEERATTSVPSR